MSVTRCIELERKADVLLARGWSCRSTHLPSPSRVLPLTENYWSSLKRVLVHFGGEIKVGKHDVSVWVFPLGRAGYERVFRFWDDLFVILEPCFDFPVGLLDFLNRWVLSQFQVCLVVSEVVVMG